MLAALLVALAASILPPAPAATARAPRLSHVAIVVLENEEAPAALRGAPWLRAAAGGGAVATRLHAETHPSLPNYLALLTGSTQGVHDDRADRTVGGPSLVDQLARAHVSWRAYMEGMPTPCYTGASSGRYAKKHNPFAIVRLPRGACRNVVPYTQLSSDRARGLPRFVWVTPDLCHDMHDCSVATGDRWLAREMPPLLQALGPRGALIITFDEGTTGAGGGGHVATAVLGAAARPGARDTRVLDHRAILATVEDALGLGRLPATRGAPTLGALLR